MDLDFMTMALEEAKKGYERGEVPVGAVLVIENEVIARFHNQIEELQDATAHAEILCLRKGAEVMKNWRLLNAVLYCTLEPCSMCAGAMIQSRISKLVWGAPDKRCGAHGSWVNLLALEHPIHRLEARGGVLQEEAAHLMQSFFRKQREEQKLGKNL